MQYFKIFFPSESQSYALISSMINEWAFEYTKITHIFCINGGQILTFQHDYSKERNYNVTDV